MCVCVCIIEAGIAIKAGTAALVTPAQRSSPLLGKAIKAGDACTCVRLALAYGYADTEAHLLAGTDTETHGKEDRLWAEETWLSTTGWTS